MSEPQSNGTLASDDTAVEEAIDDRLSHLEREMIREGSLEMAAFRRLLHGLSEHDADADPIAKVDSIIDRMDRLEIEIERLQAQLRSQRNQQRGTKKTRAKRLARNEILRQIDRGTNPIGNGGSVTVPKVIDMGLGLGVEFTHKTVGDAFQALTTEWNCFEYREGSGTKEGDNKRLVADGEAISEALWQIYRGTETKASTENAFEESSKDSTEGP